MRARKSELAEDAAMTTSGSAKSEAVAAADESPAHVGTIAAIGSSQSVDGETVTAIRSQALAVGSARSRREAS